MAEKTVYLVTGTRADEFCNLGIIIDFVNRENNVILDQLVRELEENVVRHQTVWFDQPTKRTIGALTERAMGICHEVAVVSSNAAKKRYHNKEHCAKVLMEIKDS